MSVEGSCVDCIKVSWQISLYVQFCKIEDCRSSERERERENFIMINRKHDDTCTNQI